MTLRWQEDGWELDTRHTAPEPRLHACQERDRYVSPIEADLVLRYGWVLVGRHAQRRRVVVLANRPVPALLEVAPETRLVRKPGRPPQVRPLRPRTWRSPEWVAVTGLGVLLVGVGLVVWGWLP